MINWGEEIKNMKKDVENINTEQKSLAYELIQDCKKKSKRDFALIIVLIILLFISNMMWLMYINQYDVYGEEIEQSIEDSFNSNINQEIN